jgi:hypothetical protein
VQREIINWKKWHLFFAARAERELPELASSDTYAQVPPSVARSLAIFQFGESGGGTVIEQARNTDLAGIDQEYAEAVRLFVEEEHRHAAVLAICVRNLGGSLIRKNWTAKLFVFARRLIGLRLKILVLLAAEVVGLCYYHLIATRLPQSRLQSLLAQIVNDERAHLHFHCAFIRSQTRTKFQQRCVILAWRMTMVLAGCAVLIDHRQAIRDLGMSVGTVWRRWQVYTRHAEQLMSDRHYEIVDTFESAKQRSTGRPVWQHAPGEMISPETCKLQG